MICQNWKSPLIPLSTKRPGLRFQTLCSSLSDQSYYFLWILSGKAFAIRLAFWPGWIPFKGKDTQFFRFHQINQFALYVSHPPSTQCILFLSHIFVCIQMYLFSLCQSIKKYDCIDNGDKEGKVTKEDTAEVDDEEYVFKKVLRWGVGHLEKLLKGYWHRLDL